VGKTLKWVCKKTERNEKKDRQAGARNTDKEK
jgi:hypothetical protein